MGKTTGVVETVGTVGQRLVLLPLGQLQTCPLNPRQTFEPQALAALTESVREHGLIQPLVVRPLRGGLVEPGLRFEILAGERRYHAALRADLETVPCVVRGDITSEAEVLGLMWAENDARAELGVLERARVLSRLVELGRTQDSLAREAGCSQGEISKLLGLLRLPALVQDLLAKERLTRGHGVALGRYAAWPHVQEAVAKLAAADSWPVRDCESLARAAQTLQKAGTLIQLTWELPRFAWRTVCAACPHQAFLEEGTGAYCLFPEHYKQLQDEAQAEQDARRAEESELHAAGDEARQAVREQKQTALESRWAERAADPSAAPAPPKLQEVQQAFPGATERRQIPAGCSEACPCYRECTSYEGSPSSLCLDRARYVELREQEQAALWEEVVERLRRPGAWEAALRIKVLQALLTLDPRCRAAVCAELGVPDPGSPTPDELRERRPGADLEAWAESLSVEQATLFLPMLSLYESVMRWGHGRERVFEGIWRGLLSGPGAGEE